MTLTEWSDTISLLEAHTITTLKLSECTLGYNPDISPECICFSYRINHEEEKLYTDGFCFVNVNTGKLEVFKTYSDDAELTLEFLTNLKRFVQEDMVKEDLKKIHFGCANKTKLEVE